MEAPLWHCGVDSYLKGSSAKAYDMGQDTFIGSDRFSCMNYKDNRLLNSEDVYEIRMEGILKTGFNPQDKIEIKITHLINSIPKDFEQIFSKLFIYSDFPIGQYVSIYILAFPKNKTSDRAFLTVYSPVRLANDVKAFIEKAELIIEKKPMQLSKQ
ncbi:MAG: hypothetical protein H6625_04225 [Bdellovibrionaceae bacterium]|nr:hypothetical protein [Pseudobdellovibrionaceae bacterium]